MVLYQGTSAAKPSGWLHHASIGSSPTKKLVNVLPDGFWYVWSSNEILIPYQFLKLQWWHACRNFGVAPWRIGSLQHTMNRWTTPWGVIVWPHWWIPLQTPFQIRSPLFLANDFLVMTLRMMRGTWTPWWIVWNKSYLRFPWEGQMSHKPWLQRMGDHLCNHLRWRARGLIQRLLPSHRFLPHAVPHVDTLELFRHPNLMRIWVCQFVHQTHIQLLVTAFSKSICVLFSKTCDHYMYVYIYIYLNMPGYPK